MEADFLPNLQYEVTRSISLMRKAYDANIAAYRVAIAEGDRDQAHRVAQAGHAINDAINVAQGCLYEVTQAIRTAGVEGTKNG